MRKADKFIERQRTHMNDDAYKEGRNCVHQSWFDSGTVDFWRHNRMYSTISPIADFYNKSKWLTVGDGRYGLDSARLYKKYNINILPSDISESMLRIGKERGIISEYRVENAESLSFKDDSFEVVFCKEAFHHFPRPIIGLYEMIRVASEVVILIEPNDDPSIQPKVNKRKYILSAANLIVGKLLGKSIKPYIPECNNHYYNIHGNYEPSGNYIYGISNREINKIIHALNLGGMAFYPFNDVYEEGVEFERADDKNILFKRIQDKINEFDLSNTFNMCTTIIFINKIDPNLRERMAKAGFIFPLKTNNQYIN